MATTPDQPQSPARSHPSPRKITWSELSRRQKAAYIAALIILPGVFGVGLWFFLGWAFPPSAPLTPAEQLAKEQKERTLKAEKMLDDLKEDVGRELGRNQVISVKAWEHHEGGWWYVEAEYQPLRTDRKSIDWTMMDAYKAIYGSNVPVWNASIIANADFVDPYGNESVAPIYRTEMHGDIAERVNWENHRRATSAMDVIWIHRSLR